MIKKSVFKCVAVVFTLTHLSSCGKSAIDTSVGAPANKPSNQAENQNGKQAEPSNDDSQFSVAAEYRSFGDIEQVGTVIASDFTDEVEPITKNKALGLNEDQAGAASQYCVVKLVMCKDTQALNDKIFKLNSSLPENFEASAQQCLKSSWSYLKSKCTKFNGARAVLIKSDYAKKIAQNPKDSILDCVQGCKANSFYFTNCVAAKPQLELIAGKCGLPRGAENVISPPKPGPDAPVKPGPDAPVKPGPDAPVKPGPDAPVKPGPDAPVKPGPDAPVKPGPDTQIVQPQFLSCDGVAHGSIATRLSYVAEESKGTPCMQVPQIGVCVNGVVNWPTAQIKSCSSQCYHNGGWISEGKTVTSFKKPSSANCAAESLSSKCSTTGNWETPLASYLSCSEAGKCGWQGTYHANGDSLGTWYSSAFEDACGAFQLSCADGVVTSQTNTGAKIQANQSALWSTLSRCNLNKQKCPINQWACIPGTKNRGFCYDGNNFNQVQVNSNQCGFQACPGVSFPELSHGNSYNINLGQTYLTAMWDEILVSGRITGSEADRYRVANGKLNPWWKDSAGSDRVYSNGYNSFSFSIQPSDIERRERLVLVALFQYTGSNLNIKAVYNATTRYFGVLTTSGQFVNIASLSEMSAANGNTWVSGNAGWVGDVRTKFQAAYDQKYAAQAFCQ